MSGPEPMAPVRRRALVTGASTGIGRAVARRLAAGGARVLLAGRDENRLRGACEEIRSAGGEARHLAVDIAADGGAEAAVQRAVDAMEGLDILVHCASATLNGDVFELSDAQWALGFEVKVFAGIRLARAAWPWLVTSHGSLVNICGIGARTPAADNAMTAALNAALLAITKALADRGVAEGVQVNAINPGIIRTPRVEAATQAGFGGVWDGAGSLDEALAARARNRGAIRIGEPEDVANLVAYIVSPQGEFLQGASIDLDGGATKGL